jgi:hypothetical protein
MNTEDHGFSSRCDEGIKPRVSTRGQVAKITIEAPKSNTVTERARSGAPIIDGRRLSLAPNCVQGCLQSKDLDFDF